MTRYFPSLVVGEFVDIDDESRVVSFRFGNILPNTQLLAVFDATSNQTMTFPDNLGTIVGQALAQPITNKTITDASNDVAANNLRSGAAFFPLSGTPQDGQTLVYNLGGNSGGWQHPAACHVSAGTSTPASASVAVYTLVAGMQVTPTRTGTYLVQFDGRLSTTGAASWAIFVNGVLEATSERSVSGATETGMTAQAVVSWSTGTIELRWITGGGATVGARNLAAIMVCS